MGNRLLLVFLILWSSLSFAEPSKISKEVETICITKLKVIDWLFVDGDKFSVSQRIKQWNNEYNKLHKTFPDIFTHTTEVDVERIIREVDRNKSKLKTREQQNQYIRDEANWCIYYKH